VRCLHAQQARIKRAMPQLTTIEPEHGQVTPNGTKRVRISKRMQQVVELLLSGECRTQKAAAQRVDLHPDHVCRELKKPQIQAFIARRTRETLTNARLPAAGVLLSLLDADSEHVQRDVAIRVLEETGDLRVNTAQPIGNTDVSIGYVINLFARSAMSHSQQIEGKALIDNDNVPDDEKGTS
jgi:hypothetical protein